MSYKICRNVVKVWGNVVVVGGGSNYFWIVANVQGARRGSVGRASVELSSLQSGLQPPTCGTSQALEPVAGSRACAVVSLVPQSRNCKAEQGT